LSPWTILECGPGRRLQGGSELVGPCGADGNKTPQKKQTELTDFIFAGMFEKQTELTDFNYGASVVCR
jgi:hypothetical protein